MLADKDTFENIVNAAEGAARTSFMRGLTEVDSGEIAQSIDVYGLDSAQSEIFSDLSARFLAAMHRGYQHTGGSRLADMKAMQKLSP